MNIQGVGNGVQSAEWRTTIPIVVPDGNCGATLYRFESPTVGGTGSELSALLGLKTMRELRAVLETGAGQEALTLPGPGGYKIEWSLGTIRFPLERAPSGHYVIPCDAYDQLRQQRGGIAEEAITLHADAGSSTTAPPTFQ